MTIAGVSGRAAYRWVQPDQAAVAAAYRPRGIQSGDEIAFVFIGASFCGAATEAGFGDVVKEAIEMMAARVGGKYRLRTIGVSVDWSPRKGMDFLRRMADFDELIVGQNWLNTGVQHFARRNGAPLAVPSLLIVRREVVVGDNDVLVLHERLLLAEVGTKPIRDWLARGAPVEFGELGDAPSR
ncbi:MAG: hypothetical protein ACKVZ0_12315 [Gemmatimonadales bacterium]